MPTFILFAALFVIAAVASGCQQATSTPPANEGGHATSPQSNTNGNNRPAEEKKAEPVSEPEVAGSLATPTEAYKTAYELRKKKDIAGLKKIMSNDIKEFLTMMGEAEKKTLDDVLRDMAEKPQADRAASRNEKIEGDRATLEYLAETGEWKTMDFEKVDGKWLLTFPKPSNTEMQDPEK